MCDLLNTLKSPISRTLLTLEFCNIHKFKLITYGEHVGLPEGQMGNSEVGHLTIGAGRIFQQELVRISNTVRMGMLNQLNALD